MFIRKPSTLDKIKQAKRPDEEEDDDDGSAISLIVNKWVKQEEDKVARKMKALHTVFNNVDKSMLEASMRMVRSHCLNSRL